MKQAGVVRRLDELPQRLVQWHTYDEPGGHYAAHLEPDVLATDIRRFFVPLR